MENMNLRRKKMDLVSTGNRNMLGVILLVQTLMDCAVGHGRLWEPPSRSSMWRRGYNTTINTDDNELSCGGYKNQWVSYKGLCGVCGDPYQQKPRDNEIGGKYASGIITRTYPIGGNIDVIIGLTANHLGYFEFKLCPILDPAIGETQACMDRHQLKILNGEDNGYKFYVREPNIQGNVKLTLLLRRNFYCNHCVLQWRYRTGTRWGCEHDLSCGKGKGPQEEFYGCSDISIADVSSTIYNDPIQTYDPDKGKVGLNDLGASGGHAVIWSIGSRRLPDYLSVKHEQYTKIEPQVLNEAEVRKSTGVLHNKHMDTLRHFLEELTTRALLRYYGKGDIHAQAHCSPTKRFLKNPIVHEFCDRICSYDISACPDLLCTCTKKVKAKSVISAKHSIPYSAQTDFKPHHLNKNHFKKFARKLIVKNKLVENIPPTEFSSSPSSRDFYQPKLSDVKIPRLDSMDVIKSHPMKLPFPSRFGTKRALQASNFIPMKHIPKRVINLRRVKSKPVAKSGMKFASNFDPDKFQHRTSGAHVQKIINPKIIICTASVGYSHNPFMAKWCNTNCQFGFCPPSVCSCN